MTVVVSMAGRIINSRSGNLVPNEDQDGLKQIRKAAAWSFAGTELFCQPGKENEHDGGDDNFQQHVLGNCQPRLFGVQAVNFTEWLRDQHLPVHGSIERPDIGDVRMPIAKECRDLVERLPVIPPQPLRNLEEVGVFKMVDRVG